MFVFTLSPWNLQKGKKALNHRIKIILFLVSSTIILLAKRHFLFSFKYKYFSIIDSFYLWWQTKSVMPFTHATTIKVHQYTLSQIMRSCKSGMHNLEPNEYLLAAFHLWTQLSSTKLFGSLYNKKDRAEAIFNSETPGNQESNHH